jgi:hypothetical protein
MMRLANGHKACLQSSRAYSSVFDHLLAASSDRHIWRLLIIESPGDHASTGFDILSIFLNSRKADILLYYKRGNVTLILESAARKTTGTIPLAAAFCQDRLFGKREP